MKKVTAFLMILMVAVFICSSCSADQAFSKKPLWEANSRATLTWEAIDEADYYRVEISVSHEGTAVGSTTTGTSATSLDVQQEIRDVVGSSEYDAIKAKARVIAGMTDDEGAFTQLAISEYSEELTYRFVSAIAAPKNLYLDPNTYDLTFDAVEGAASYELIYCSSASSGPGFSLEVKDGKVKGNIKEFLKKYYYIYGHAGETEIVYVNARAYDKDGIGSRWSQPSNGVSFYADAPVSAPKNLYINPDTYVLTFDAVEGAASYELIYCSSAFSGAGGYPLEVNNGVVSGNIKEFIKKYYFFYGHAGETENVYINARAYTADGIGSQWSQVSNTVSFYADPPISAPQNLYLDPETYELTFSAVKDAVSYELIYCSSAFSGPGGYPLEINNGVVKGNIKEFLKKYYYEYGHTGETENVYVNVRAYNADGIGSRWSAPSNTVEFSDFIRVSSITLSPTEPVLCVEHTLYIGKTVLPANAYYTGINWESSDKSVVEINASGMLIGRSAGEATVTASIGMVSQSITVHVYAVESNIEDQEDQQEVADTAGSIIDDIGNHDDPDLSGTDLTQGEIAGAQKDIHEGAERGDTFRSDLMLSKRDQAHFRQYWDEIQQIVKGGVFAGGYDINVEVYHQEKNGKKHHITNITQLNKEIGFTVEGESSSGTTDGKMRNFVLVRIHDGKVEAIPVSEKGNNQFAAKSKLFSEFVLMYTDQKVDPIVTAPATRTGLVYNGKAQELLIAGSASGGTMQYALGADAVSVPTEGWSTTVPTGTEAGTYYAWYKVVGDENHNDTVPVCLMVMIAESGSGDPTIPETDPEGTEPDPEVPETDPDQGGGSNPEPVQNKIDIYKAKISVNDQEYTGKALKPKLTVKVNGKALKAGTDYSVSYKNNKAIGKATATITGVGDYSGTKSVFFRILPKTVKLESLKYKDKILTVKWKKGSGIDGYEIEYGLKKDFKGAKKITVGKAKTTEYGIKKLKAKKTYYVRIRAYKKVKGKKYYSEWSKGKSVKVK